MTEYEPESLQRFQDLIDQIAEGVSAEVGDAFFRHLVQQLSNVFHTHCALIGVLDSARLDQVTTLAVCMDGELVPNFTYPLKHSPCEDVIEQDVCVHHCNVQNLYPNDELLVEMGAESYVGTPLFDSEQKPIGIVVLLDKEPLSKDLPVADIIRIFAARASAEIERSRSHDRLLQTQYRLAQHIHNTPLAVIEWDPSFHIEDWNPAAETIFGWKREQTIGRGLEFLLSKDGSERRKCIQELHKVVVSGHSSTVHMENRRADGQVISCIWYHSPTLADDGEVVAVSSMVADKTFERQALQAVHRQETEQREILDSLVDAVITIDQKGQVLSFNRAAENLFGYPADSVIGENIRMLMPIEFAVMHDQYLRNYLETGQAKIIGRGRDVEILTDKGEKIPVRLSVSELPRLESGERRFVGTCHDLREIKARDEMLRRSQKMDSLGKLTGGIAHDFNNILGVVTGYAEMLSSHLQNGSKEKRYADEIKRASRRGARLTEKLLAFSRVKASQQTVVDLNDCIQNAYGMLSKTLTPRVHISLSMADSLWRVKLDAGDFEDALLNMCINASHAIGEHGGDIGISTENVSLDFDSALALQLDSGDYVHLVVDDSGCGIEAEHLPQVFDPFFTMKGERGSGLGLSQVYGFVQRCHGHIYVESVVGEGTQFHLYFPRCQEASAQENTTIHESTDGKAGLRSTTERHILVVDDEAAMSELCREVLSDAGYQVVAVSSGHEALSLLETQRFDLVISDIVMPDMDGYQLAEHIVKGYPDTKVQLMSGYASGQLHRVDESMRQSILVKPFSPYVLLKRVATHFNKHDGQRSKDE